MEKINQLKLNGSNTNASLQVMHYSKKFKMDGLTLLRMAHSIRKSIPEVYGENVCVKPLPKINGSNGNRDPDVKFTLPGHKDVLEMKIMAFDEKTVIFKVYDGGVGAKKDLEKAIGSAIENCKQESLQLA